MTRRRRLAGATIGLLLLAAPIAPLRAQTTTTEAPLCPDAVDELAPVEITSQVSPSDGTTSTSATVEVDATFTNVSSRRRLPTDPPPNVTAIHAKVIACDSSQAVPDESTADVSGPPGRSLHLAWSPVFETDGQYALEFRVSGDRTGSPPQSGRYVVAINLAVPPRKPTDVKASTANGVVTVTWSNADREKDLIAYEVLRARQGSSNYVTVKDGLVAPNVNAVSDSPPEGAWRYQVIAYREDGAASAPSSDATVEVAGPPSAAGSSGGGGSSSGGGDTGNGTGADSTGKTAAGSNPAITNGEPNTVDLSNFARALNARRAATPQRVEPPDPGFNETLPFGAADGLGSEKDPQELGADQPNNLGLGQSIAADPSERRRSLGFVAFGLLLFVLSMTGLFVKSEVKRVDLVDLDAIDEVDEPSAGPEEAPPLRISTRRRLPRPLVAPAVLATEAMPAAETYVDDFADLIDPHAAAVAAARTAARRSRREVAPLDAPGLDVLEPPPPRPPARGRASAGRR